MIERKRAQAEAMRMQTMQQIQHRQANPESFLQRKNKPTDEVEKTVSFDAGSNGHFYVPAALNGKNVDFIADTGASDIFLTQEDAKKIGISTYNLNYSLIYNTANGQVKAAQTNVQSLAVGPIVLNNIPVSISENNGGVSLLGMAFFNKLSRYEVKEGKLTLYQ
jgi:aspartyl protease family protein